MYAWIFAHAYACVRLSVCLCVCLCMVYACVWLSVRRGPGWRIHGSVEDTKLSTNKQHTLSVCLSVYFCVYVCMPECMCRAHAWIPTNMCACMIICAQTHAHTRTHILAHKEKRGGKEKKARPHTYLRASAHSLSQHKSTHANTRTFSHHTLNTKAHANTSTYICIYVFHVHMYICVPLTYVYTYIHMYKYTRNTYIQPIY